MPFALVATGALALCFSGCKKEEAKPELPSNSPAVYMKDPVYLAKVEAMEREQKAVAAELRPILKRMKEISAPDGKTVRQEDMAEWKDLTKKADALKAKAEAIRQRQLAALREKMTPVKEISK